MDPRPHHRDAARAQCLGESRQGRPVWGYRFGRGPLHVSLIGGCHADEPVGPALLERLAAVLAAADDGSPLLTRARWWLVPWVNPDGRAANAPWQDPRGGTAGPTPAPEAYDLAAYLRHVQREGPGDDLEFGFPRGPEDAGARPEARAVADFLAEGAPLHLHATLHGMAFAAGPWFLLEEAWAERTAPLRGELTKTVRRMGYRLHDVDRGGEKGFRRLAEGFSTRPDSGAMEEHFRRRGEPETAALFRPSSMEYVRSLGGDPLTLVSEMPLFLADDPPPEGSDRPPLPEDAAGRERFRDWLAELQVRARTDSDSEEEADRRLRRRAAAAGIRPMPVGDQMRLQLAFLQQGLATVVTHGDRLPGSGI